MPHLLFSFEYQQPFLRDDSPSPIPPSSLFPFSLHARVPTSHADIQMVPFPDDSAALYRYPLQPSVPFDSAARCGI